MDADEETKHQHDEEEEQPDAVDIDDPAAAEEEEDVDADGDAHMSDDHAADDGDGDERKSNSDAGTAASKTLKRPVSAYFLFMSNLRPTLIAELDAAAASASASSGTEVKSQSKSLAVIGKLAGERWKTLPEDEKEQWQAKAAELKAAYDAAILADPSLKAAPKQKDGGDAAGGPEFVIPLSRLKKIIHLDPSGSKMSKEAVLLTEKATEQFLLWIAERSHLQAQSHKRKTLKAQDVEHTVRTTARLEFLRAPLKRDFALFAASESAASEQRKERAGERQAKKQKQAEEDGGGAGAEGENGEGAAGEEDGEDAVPADQEEEHADEGARSSKKAAAASPAVKKAAPPKSRTIDSMFSKA
jgi:histone H3/H4